MDSIVVWLSNPEIGALHFDARNHARLAAALPDSEVTVCEDREAFLETLGGATVALVWRFDQAWFDRAPHLRFLSTPSAGKELVDIMPPPTVRLHYGSFHGRAMAETVVGFMLAARRGILRAAWTPAEQAWPRTLVDRTARLVGDSHVVIVGFGHIGQWIGRHAKAFGARVTGVKRDVRGVQPEYFEDRDRVVPAGELDGVLPGADELVLCLPSGADTDHLLNRKRLGRLPAHAWVYNVGRGNAIDEEALEDALRGGALAGACLDVFQTEPLPEDSPLRSVPNLLRLPHASAFWPGYMDAYLDEVLPLLSG